MTDVSGATPRPNFSSVYRLSGDTLRLHDAGGRIPRAALGTRAREALIEALNADADFRHELAELYAQVRDSLPGLEALRSKPQVIAFTQRWQLCAQDVLDAVLLSHIEESTTGAADPRLSAPIVVHAGAPPPQELSLLFTYDLAQETPKQVRRRLTSLVLDVQRQMDALERDADMVPVPPRESWDDLCVAAGRWILYLKGIPVGQIAAHNSVSVDAVKSGLRRWRRKLGITRSPRPARAPKGAHSRRS